MITDATLSRVLPGPIVRLGGDLIRVALAFLLAIWCALWLIVAVVLAQHYITRANYADFGRFLYSTREFVAGRRMYAPVPASFRAPEYALRQRTDLDPPHFHLVFLPLVNMPDAPAYAAWMLAGLATLAWSARRILSSLGVRARAGTVGLLAAAGICSVPFQAWAATGQVTMVMLGPLTAAWRAARSGRWTRAGAWLGVAWSLKPFLAVFAVYFLIVRRWRALAAAAAMTLAAFALGIAIFGWRAERDWIVDLEQVTWFSEGWNSSLTGIASRAVTSGAGFQGIVTAPGLLFPISAAAAAVILLVSGRTIARDSNVDRDWALVLIVALLVSPLSWVYYWIWLAAPLAARWMQIQHRGWKMVALAGAAMFWFPWPFLYLGQPSGILSVTLGSAYGLGLLLLWLSVLSPARAATSPARGTRPVR